MAINWARTMFGAAGAGGSNEWYVQGRAYGNPPYSYFANRYNNVIVNQNTGNIYTLRVHSRPGVSNERYWDEWSADGKNIKSASGQTNQANKVYLGYPKIDHDTSNTYDFIEPSGQTGASSTRYTDVGSGSSPYGNYRNFNSAYLYSGGYWNNSSNVKTYNIGNRTYQAKGSNNQGGAVGSWQHTSSSYPFSLVPGHYNTYNSTPGGGSFVEMFPINPASQSTDHLVWHSSNYHTYGYRLDSNLHTTGTNNAFSYPSGSLNQYWATGAIDRDNDTIYMAKSTQIWQWNYSTNARKLWTVQGLTGNPRHQSNWLHVQNGYLYHFLPTSSGGLHLLKMDTSDISSSPQAYLIKDTSGYGAPGNNYIANQEGFLVEGPNTYLGDTDLLALGFSNYDSTSSGSQQNSNLAIVKWDNIPEIATHGNNISVASASLSLSGGNSFGTSGNSTNRGSNGLSNQYQNAPNNSTAYFSSVTFPSQGGNPSTSVGPLNL